jgi:CO/xanthine dehydrogenase FAD-binding subunit
MTKGTARPAVVVDLRYLRELATVGLAADAVRIGATVTHAEIRRDRLVAAHCPLLASASGTIGGGLQVANRGTVGGTVCYANPVGDYLPCLVALDACVVLRSNGCERRVRVAELVTDAFTVDRRPNELAVGVEVPARARARAAYEKLKFADGCYGIANAACHVEIDEGICRSARLVVGGVEATPRLLTAAAAALVGTTITPKLAREAGELAIEAIEAPRTDALADGDYRRRVTGVLVARAIVAAAIRAER